MGREVGAEVERSRDWGSREGSSGTTKSGGMEVRIPERAVRYAGLMWLLFSVKLVVVVVVVGRERNWELIMGTAMLKTSCLDRRRILASLCVERTSSGLRIREKPCAVVSLVGILLG